MKAYQRVVAIGLMLGILCCSGMLALDIAPQTLKYITRTQKSERVDKENGGASVVRSAKGPQSLSDRWTKLVKTTTEKAERALGEKFPVRSNLISGAFWAEKHVAGKQMINKYVKDNRGWLQQPIYNAPASDLPANQVNQFVEFCEGLGIDCLYVLPLNRNVKGETQLPYGLEDMSNEILDGFVDQVDLPMLDLREKQGEFPMGIDQMFYKTDAHWTIPASLWAALQTVAKMNADMGLDISGNEAYMDYENYTYQRYEDHFLGGYGRQTYEDFSGVDDFVSVMPKEKGNYFLTQILDGEILHTRSGSFEQALVYDEMITEVDLDFGYAIKCYTSYLGYGNTVKSIRNLDNKEGKKLLVLGASFTRPYSCFLAPFFLEVHNIDIGNEEVSVNIYDYVKEYQPDYVIISVGRRKVMEGSDTGF